jgi:hypothetical protein
MSGRTSTQPHMAHSRRMMSQSLLIASGCATVFVRGKESGRRLKPCAIAASSMMSHSCRTSGRVGGTATASVSPSAPAVAVSDMRESSVACSAAERDRPVQLLMYDACAVACLVVRSGVSFTVPSGYTIRTGSILAQASATHATAGRRTRTCTARRNTRRTLRR